MIDEEESLIKLSNVLSNVLYNQKIFIEIFKRLKETPFDKDEPNNNSE
jgi:hypothetical protein